MMGIIEVNGKDAEAAQIMFELADLRLDNKRLREELAVERKSYLSASKKVHTLRAELATCQTMRDELYKRHIAILKAELATRRPAEIE